VTLSGGGRGSDGTDGGTPPVRLRGTAVPPSTPSPESAIDAWLDYLEVAGRAPRTIAQYGADVENLVAGLGEKALSDITDQDLLAALEAWPNPSTRRTRKEAYSSFFRWALKTGLLDRNPVDLLPDIVRPKQRVPEIFTEEEVAKLLALPLEDRALVGLLVDAGLRKGEAIALRAENVARDRLTVRGGKGGKDRIVPLVPRLARDLAALKLEPECCLWYSRPGGGEPTRDRAVSGASFDRWWSRVLSAAGVPYRNAHTARHTFATRWLRRGGRLTTLSKAMGHASYATTSDLYGHLDETDMAADIALMEAA
jgi:integrase